MAGAFVIAVSEQRQSALAGCAGQDYTSPPQSLEQARALAGLLLGAPVTGAARGGTRSRAVSARSSSSRSLTRARQPAAHSPQGRGLAAARNPQKGGAQ